MGMLDYFNLKRKYNELLTKYDIADDLQSILEKRSALHKENAELSQSITSKKEEAEALEKRIEALKSMLGGLESIAEIEAREKKLLDEKTKKFATSNLIIALYNRKGTEGTLLDAFVFTGQITYMHGLVMASEYQSLSGSLSVTLKDKTIWSTLSNKVAQSDNKKVYNANINDWVSFEEVCKAFDIPLYLENEVTYEEVMEVLKKIKYLYPAYLKYCLTLSDFLEDINKAKNRSRVR